MSADRQTILRRVALREGRCEIIESREWTCESCPTMTEPGERYCRHCKMYWADVGAGMFDHDY